jgi:hypothetical protein
MDLFEFDGDSRYEAAQRFPPDGAREKYRETPDSLLPMQC